MLPGEVDEVRQVEDEQKERRRDEEDGWQDRERMLEDKKTGVERGKLSN